MDILKELFGTSDELQISKSLFGGDGGAGSEELVLGEPAGSRYAFSCTCVCIDTYNLSRF